MAQEKQPINIRIKCREGEDPERILAAIGNTLGNKRSRPLNVDIDTTGDSEPPKHDPQFTPDEGLETEVALRINQSLDVKNAMLEKQNKTSGQRRQASPKKRISARRSVQAFPKWCADKFGGATIVVIVRAGFELLKKQF